MPPSLGVNLRVTGHCNQGGRKYMEDVFSVAYQQTEDEKDLEYAFFGIYDGHGGSEASQYAKNHLMDSITKQKNFWSDDDDLVLKAIREGFLTTQQAMWKDLPNWKKTASGLPSTAGTTASVCFIKRGKLFIGHVGDSGIILGERDPHHPTRWRAKPLTRDHKPDCEIELKRIHEAGGKVVAKSGVPRVVWYRPAAHQGPIRRSTHVEEIPFLAVARALGDLWSYNSKDDVFVVSPDPDLHVIDLNVVKDRCLILATDGLWNVLSPGMAVQSVFDTERNNEKHMIDPHAGHTWINPSKKLVDLSIQRWNMCDLRADNVSVVTVMLDPPGPPRAKVLRRLHGLESPNPKSQLSQPIIEPKGDANPEPPSALSEARTPPQTKGIAIISRFPNSKNECEQHGTNLVAATSKPECTSGASSPFSTRIVHDSTVLAPLKMMVSPSSASRLKAEEASAKVVDSKLSEPISIKEKIQCSEISSSDTEIDSPAPPVPARPVHTRRSQPLGRKNCSVGPTQPLGPATRTRQQSGHATGKVLGSSPPPLPVKQVRRSIIPVHSGYNSDCENQSGHANKMTTKLTTDERQNLRATIAPSKVPVAPATFSKRQVHKMETGCKTPEPSSRVLRSQTGTPQCRFNTSSAPKALSKSAAKLPQTGIKRKRRSVEAGVPNLASKMIKMSRGRSWANNLARKASK